MAVPLMFLGPVFEDLTGVGFFNFNCELREMLPLSPCRISTIQIRHRDLSGPPYPDNSIAFFLVTLDDFLGPFVPPIIRQVISSVPLDPGLQPDLHGYMISVLRRIARRPIRSCHIVFNIDFSTTWIAANDDEEAMFNQVLRESLDTALASSHGAPASATAIEALKKKKIATRVEFREEKCVICQDEFSESEIVSEMPCSHIFHGQCILEWLRQSHYCPTCRFEMPTQESLNHQSQPAAPVSSPNHQSQPAAPASSPPNHQSQPAAPASSPNHQSQQPAAPASSPNYQSQPAAPASSSTHQYQRASSPFERPCPR